MPTTGGNVVVAVAVAVVVVVVVAGVVVVVFVVDVVVVVGRPHSIRGATRRKFEDRRTRPSSS